MTAEDAEIKLAEQRAVSIYDRIDELKVDSAETYLLMAELVKEVKKVTNKFEEETRPEIDQAHKLHKALLARKRKWAEKFEAAEHLGKEKLRHFEATTSVPPIEGISFSDSWDGEIVDESLLPREYLKPDLDKLRGVTKALKGETSISGWKPKSVKIVSVRS